MYPIPSRYELALGRCDLTAVSLEEQRETSALDCDRTSEETKLRQTLLRAMCCMRANKW